MIVLLVRGHRRLETVLHHRCAHQREGACAEGPARAPAAQGVPALPRRQQLADPARRSEAYGPRRSHRARQASSHPRVAAGGDWGAVRRTAAGGETVSYAAHWATGRAASEKRNRASAWQCASCYGEYKEGSGREDRKVVRSAFTRTRGPLLARAGTPVQAPKNS